uniref:Uncharacterized protein n=1 Tax=Cucumis melo TaxID=3656 RepID=A0A9I9EFE6_CUCME
MDGPHMSESSDSLSFYIKAGCCCGCGCLYVSATPLIPLNRRLCYVSTLYHLYQTLTFGVNSKTVCCAPPFLGNFSNKQLSVKVEERTNLQAQRFTQRKFPRQLIRCHVGNWHR